jgi:hypothetical protein
VLCQWSVWAHMMIPIDQRSPWLSIFPLSLTTTVSVNSGLITLYLDNCIAYMPFDILNGRQNLQGFTLHHSSHRMIMLTESMSLCPWLVALYIICFSFYIPVLSLEIPLSEGWDSINRYILPHHKVRGGCSFCWYWSYWWPSLFKLSFHKCRCQLIFNI